MTAQNIALTRKEEKEVARLYAQKTYDGKPRYTQSELASQFLVAPVTIRRALAEQGVLELAGYKTRKDSQMLELLKEAGITSVKDLQEVLEDAGINATS